MSKQGWYAKGIPEGKEMDYVLAHEIAHALQHQWRRDPKFAEFFKKNFDRSKGALVGTYARIGGPDEAFAEAFAAVWTTPSSTWAYPTKQLATYLQNNRLMPKEG